MTLFAKHRRLALTVASGVAFGLSVGAAQAAPMMPSNDHRADDHARGYITIAMTDLSDHDQRAALDRLERAETALLNREAFDLGAGLDTAKPLPQTPAMTQIEMARTALLSHQTAPAHRYALRAEKDIGSAS